MTATSRSLLGSVRELAVVIVVAVGLAIGIQAWIVKPYRIPSGSMEPTLAINQRILVDRIGTHFSSPQIGDIVVFHPPQNYAEGCVDPTEGQNGFARGTNKPCGVAWRRQSSETFVKRVVGLPGDTISIRNGRVYRNGKREADSYIVQCHGSTTCEFPGTITVPPDEYYMMGDNRPDSEDSRFWGPVPKGWIIGEAFFTYWPLGRIGFL